jgi:hypothetical protein
MYWRLLGDGLDRNRLSAFLFHPRPVRDCLGYILATCEYLQTDVWWAESSQRANGLFLGRIAREG